VVLDILDREGGAVRMTIGKVVKKEFLGVNAVQRVSDLITIYDLLKLKGVPNVDTLNSSNLNGHPHVYLSPVGFEVLPVSGSEAFSAVVCVLWALMVCYDVSVFII
jgi:hypothetical protein